MAVFDPLSQYDPGRSSQLQQSTTNAINAVQGAARSFRDSGLDPNLFNQFQANIPGQTVSALNMARSGIRQQAAQGGLASGTSARMQRQATESELGRMALQQLRGYRTFQEFDQRMRAANRGQYAALTQATAGLQAQREMADMSLMQALTGQRVASDTQLEAARMQAAAARRASMMGAIGSIGGAFTGGLLGLFGGSVGGGDE